MAVPGTWDYLEFMLEEDKMEAQRSKRFKMIERKKEVCDCPSCSQKNSKREGFQRVH